MAQKKNRKKTPKGLARRKPAPKNKILKAKRKITRKSPNKGVKETLVAESQRVQAIVQDTPVDLEERQEQIHDAEDAIVDEKEEEEMGEAV